MAVKKGYNRFFIIFQEEDKGFGIAIDKQPTGYAKIEVRNGKCKITVYVQNLKREKAPYYFCMMDTVKPPPLLTRLGEIKIDETGKGETWWEYNEENIGDTARSVDKLNTAVVVTEGEGIPSPLMGFTGKEKPLWRELLQAKEESARESESESEAKAKAKAKVEENRVESSETLVRGEGEALEPIVEASASASSSGEETPILDEEGIRFKQYEQELKQRVEELGVLEENPQSELRRSNSDSEELTPREAPSEYEYEAEAEAENENKAEEEIRLWEQPILEIDRDAYRDKEPKEQRHKRWSDNFHKILMDHEEVEELLEDSEDNIRWWKIPYKNSISIRDEEQYPYIYTIFHLNMIYPYIDYIKYFYDRGYYYFGIKYDGDGEVKYIIYGIEGNPILREQPCMGMTGFYKCLKLKNRNMGMWIMVYNPTTGNFMIEKDN